MDASRQRSSAAPLRVCHVLETSGGGSGQVVLELARYGRRLGDDITVIYSTSRAETRFVSDLQAIPGVKLFTAPMKRHIGLHDIRDAWLLWKIIRKAGPFDIVHAHSSKAGALVRLAGLFFPYPVIYTPHAFYSMMNDVSPIYGLLERVLSWLSAGVVCVSEGELRHGQSLKIAASKLSLIPNGASPRFSATRDEARKALHMGADDVVFGFVGRFERQKNPVRAVAAFAQAARQHARARLALVGDGALRPDVEREIVRQDMQRNIVLLGARDSRALIPAFDCLIGSSDYETLPISFIECLNAGVPIITTPVGGIEEAVIAGKTGFTANAFTTEALSDAVALYLSKNDEERREMAAIAKEHAKNFSRESMGEKYRDLYCRTCRKSLKTLAPASEASVPS